MNNYDCICEYEINYYIECAHMTQEKQRSVSYCRNCGSIRIEGKFREYPKVLRELKEENDKKTSKLQELETALRAFDEARGVCH